MPVPTRRAAQDGRRCPAARPSTLDTGRGAAVELNDKSHGSKRAQARDEFVAGVCRAIGVPLLQVVAQRSYSVVDIRAQLQATIGVAEVQASTVVQESGRL